jgi:uncharacterized protein YqgC (DUF456 family)
MTMDTDTLAIVIVTITALASTFFTVVPLLPGTLLVPIGALACGFVVGFSELPWWSWLLQALLVASSLLVDNLAQALGVRRVGGSRAAMLGGAIGVFVGPLVLALVIGPLALLLGPALGAVVGTIAGEEYALRRSRGERADRSNHVRLGTGALVAFVLGTTVKLVLVTAQVVLLVLLMLR